MARIDSPAPVGSRGARSGSREVGTRKRPATKAIATTGRLTRKTDPHQKCSSSQPLVIGPMAPPAPAIPAQMAMARARSSGGNTLVRIDSVAGITSDAPAPISARQAVSWFGEFETDARNDPVPNTASPTASAPLRPYRSPRDPLVSRSPANTML